MPVSGRIATYLNDHLAGSVAAQELARRAASSNRDTPYGVALSRLLREIEEDREVLQAVMGALGVGVDRIKTTAAWIAEKLGRLKLNGSLVSYSPLSRMEELEILTLGVHGKLLMWEALKQVEPLSPGLSRFDFDGLIERAHSQLETLTEQRAAATVEALG